VPGGLRGSRVDHVSARQLLLVVLAAGFAYSAVSIGTLYRTVLAAGRASGPDATIDAMVRPLEVTTAEQIRLAVTRAGWPRDVDVSLVDGSDGSLSAGELAQARYALGYLLFPARIWMRSATDARTAASQRDQRHIIVIGGQELFPLTTTRQVSRLLALVELP